MSTESPETEGSKIPSELRDLADKGLGKARDVLGSFLEKARKGAEGMQNATQTAELPAGQAFARGLAFAEQNVAAAFDHAQKLVRAPSVQEAVKLQTDYFKEQSAALKAQTEELTELVKTDKPEGA